ncbi:MAG: DNA polymerase I [Clostridia bacterium]|nr:DNA polymerase I [Clostridia bacterium]
MPDKLMLIDGNSLINRAFFGLAGRNRLTAPDGTPTGALYAFLNMFLRFKAEYGPDQIVAAFDRKEPTFRHQMFDGYKATRKGMPDDLAAQMPILKELLDLMGVGRVEVPGFEADDILGTLARQAESEGREVAILTGDKDSFQLVDEHISIWHPVTTTGKTEVQIYTPESVRARYTIGPELFVDLKAIMGDPSDNIPGVKGIGEKGALELVSRFGSLDQIYEHLADIKPNLAAKLAENRDMAYLSRQLSQIDCAVPLPVSLSELKSLRPDRQALLEMLARLDFRSLVAKLGLDSEPVPPSLEQTTTVAFISGTFADFKAAIQTVKNQPDGCLAFILGPDGQWLWSVPGTDPHQVHGLQTADLTQAWDLLAQEALPTLTYDYKKTLRTFRLPALPGLVRDVLVAAYLLNQLDGKPDFTRLYSRVTGQNWPFLGPGSAAAASADAQSAGKDRQQDLFSVLESAAPASPTVQVWETWNLEQSPLAVAALSDLWQAQKQAIAERGIQHLAYQVELPLAGVLAEMELQGFAIDQTILSGLSQDMQKRIDALQEQIFTLSGKTFNLMSPKQLGAVLFDHLGLATGKKRSGGNYSTDSEELERLIDQHPVIAPIIEHRLLAKLRSTFVEGLLKAIDPADGRVHTTFNQVLTATGRLSSTEPNLQNIPIRSEQGNQIRAAFIASPGHVLLDADYSQIELRLLAHLAQDPAMQQAFNENEDIHTNTACHIFGVAAHEVTSAQRSVAKTVNFSIVYGISDFGLARDLGVTVKQAHQYIAGYNSQYPHVRAYLEQIVKQAYEQGYVETLFGRRRYLPELQSANRNLRQFGERAAMNTPIQGTAADLIKMAMVRARNLFIQEGLKARLVLQVHDELIVEAPLAEAAAAAALLKQAMEDALELSVPLIAEVKQGQRWSECKD